MVGPKFIEPPRPETAILPSRLSCFQAKGWICQLKKNGILAVIALSKQGVKAWSRHGLELDPRRLPDLPVDRSKDWTVLAGELLPGRRMYFFDSLVAQGESLLDQPYSRRLRWLERLLPGKESGLGEALISPNVWRLIPLTEPIDLVYDRMVQEGAKDTEGIVLKWPTGLAIRPYHQVKCRITCDKHLF